MSVINTLADVTRVHAQLRGDSQALLYADDGRAWTYAELDTQANIVANALLDAGVGAGERVAYLDKNSPEYFKFSQLTTKPLNDNHTSYLLIILKTL